MSGPASRSTRGANEVGDCSALPEPDVEEIARFLGLSLAEARVARLVSQGAAIAQISAELAITAETVRTHMKRVLHKTGCARQAELVRLLSSR